MTEPNDPFRPLERYPSENFANVVAAVRNLQHPTEIGPYAIVGVIGEGGMGTVYRAEQRRPIKRIVAVKVIKLGMDTREVIGRFDSERQALAMMNHPNVARVLDAGATDTGRPFFVMELVEGEPITTFADRRQLTIRQRLELFTQACDAVQHAHQKAIIHRDLKPSNILVMLQDDRPVVKVIDFGVAKAISHRLTERTLFTETGQLVGTPEYMPPEQADGALQVDVDTRSDVYSLGVVLYELLSGALPFDAQTLRSQGYLEIQRIIRDVDPPRPSTRLSGLGKGATEVARLRQTPLDSLSRVLRSELEWIPLKAMRKDRADRYSSAAELAQDIQNYLASRPLLAGPESRAYRTRKFMRRNWRGVSIAAGMGLLLVAGIVATTWQAVRATRAEQIATLEKREADVQRTKAEEASANLTEVNRFLTDDLLASASPDVSRGRELTVREAVDRAAETVAERFKGRPTTEAAVRLVLADTYDSLGLPNIGLPHALAAVELLLRQHGPDHIDTLAAQRTRGVLLASLNQYADAEAVHRDTYDRCMRVLGPEAPQTLRSLNSLALSVRRQRRFAEAEPLYRSLLEATRRVFGSQSPEMAAALNGMSVVLSEQERYAEAEPFLREALELHRREGTDRVAFLTALSNFSKLLQNQGKLPEAEAEMREALKGRRRILKDDHPQTLSSMNDLAWILAERGKFEEAEALSREALSTRRRVLGADNRDTLQSMNALGRILTLEKKYDEAEQVLKQTIEARRRVLGEKHAHTLGSMMHLATVYELQGRYAEAEPLLEHVCRPEMLASLSGQDADAAVARYGLCLEQQGKHSSAEPVLVNAAERLSKGANNADRAKLRDVLSALASLYDKTSRPAEAATVRSRLAALPAIDRTETAGAATTQSVN